jgi:diacylglycerol O-acyltransferase-1
MQGFVFYSNSTAIPFQLLISVPLHTFKLYFFFGMMAQIPALFFGKYFQGSVVGNLMFWITFCFVGQPIGILLYYFDYTSDILKSALVPTVA